MPQPRFQTAREILGVLQNVWRRCVRVCVCVLACVSAWLNSVQIPRAENTSVGRAVSREVAAHEQEESSAGQESAIAEAPSSNSDQEIEITSLWKPRGLSQSSLPHSPPRLLPQCQKKTTQKTGLKKFRIEFRMDDLRGEDQTLLRQRGGAPAEPGATCS